MAKAIKGYFLSEEIELEFKANLEDVHTVKRGEELILELGNLHLTIPREVVPAMVAAIKAKM